MNCRTGLLIMILVSTLLAACGTPTIAEPPPTRAPAPPAQPTAMAEPTQTPEPVTVQPTATPKPVAVQPTATSTDASGCPIPPEGEKSTVGVMRGQLFCITWVDSFSDERGFRVLLEYLRSGERFSYEVGPNTVLFPVPAADAPSTDASGEQCMARKDFMVTVIALRPGGETLVDGMASEGECWRTPPDSSAQTPVVVYQSRSDGSVRAISLDTGVEMVLADPTEPDQLLPWAPAPDGRSIAMITGRAWNRKAGGSFTASLWTVNVDGSQPRKLLDLLPRTYAPADMRADFDLREALINPFASSLKWTPDGHTIVLVSAHEGQVDLYAVAADGSAARRLTNTPDYESPVTLSPNERALAYTSVSSFGTGGGPSNLRSWLQLLDGGEPFPIPGAPDEGGAIIGWAGEDTIVGQTGNVAENAVTLWATQHGPAPLTIYRGPAGAIAWHQQRGALAFAASDPFKREIFVWQLGQEQPTSLGVVGSVAQLVWAPDEYALLICVGDVLYGDASPAQAELLLWREGRLRHIGNGGCGQLAWAQDGRLAIGGGSSGRIIGFDGSTLRQLPEDTFPVGWQGDALLFFAPSKRGDRPWQLYRAIGERDEPLVAPIAVQPSEPRLVTIANPL